MAHNTRFLASNIQYSRFTLDFFLSEMRRFAFNRIDFVPQPPHFFVGSGGYEPVKELIAALSQADVCVSVLTPLPYRYSITAPLGKQKNATISYYTSTILLAAELGCTKLVLGAAGACWDLSCEVLLQNAKEILSTLCETAEKADVRILLAPVMGRETPLIAEAPVLNRASEIKKVIDGINNSAIGVCIDTNVISSCGETIQDYFDLLGDKIALVRLCDGNYHGWCAWGDGVLPVERFLETLNNVGYTGDISLLLHGERYFTTPSYQYEKFVRNMVSI